MTWHWCLLLVPLGAALGFGLAAILTVGADADRRDD